MSFLHFAKLFAFPLVFIGETWAYTPPKTEVPKEEERRVFGRADFVTRNSESALTLGRRFLYTCHICEIAAILAHEVPPTVSARVLAALFFLSPDSPTVASDRLALSHSFAAGTLLLFTGGALRKLCYRTLGRLFTYQLGVLKDHALVTTGPYAVVRHPAYAGLLLAHAGLVLVQLGPGSFIYECGILTRWWGALGFSLWGVWVALMLVSTLARPAKEDEVLRRVFGREWEEWARKTPYRMIPYIY